MKPSVRFLVFWRRRLILFCALAMILCITRQSTALMIPLPEEEIARQASAIALGRITQRVVIVNQVGMADGVADFGRKPNGESDADIITEYTVEVLEAMKGPIKDGDLITLRLPGGLDESSGIQLWVEHVPRMAVGWAGIFYLKPKGQGYRFVAQRQGLTRLISASNLSELVRINRDAIERARALAKGLTPPSRKAATPMGTLQPGPQVTNILYQVGTGVGVGTGEVYWIVGSNFSGADKLIYCRPLIYGHDQSDVIYENGQMMNGLLIYWDAGLLIRHLPVTDFDTYEGSGMMGIWKFVGPDEGFSNPYPFQVSFIYYARLPNNSWDYQYDTSNANLAPGQTTAQAEAALDNARNTWNTACGVSLNRNQSSPYKIEWVPKRPEDPDGILAGNWINATFDGTVTFTRIEFYNHHSWSTTPTGDQKDIEAVALHELGHSLCLLDLYGDPYPEYDGPKVMYGYNFSFLGWKRTLSSHDIRGAQWIYP